MDYRLPFQTIRAISRYLQGFARVECNLWILNFRSRRYDDSDDERGGRGGRSKPVWMEKYGPPTRTDYRVIVENLSSRVSWQVCQFLFRSKNRTLPFGGF